VSNRSDQGDGWRVEGGGYKQLVAWQRAHALALAVFRALQAEPPPDRWLRNQCVRSAVSVGANIAEGYSRGSLREYIQFLNIARGSLAETDYHLLFLKDAGLLTEESFERLQPLILEAGSVLLGLLRALERKDNSRERLPKKTGDEPAAYATADLHPSPSTLHPPEAP
jgi:four helix bundle protein